MRRLLETIGWLATPLLVCFAFGRWMGSDTRAGFRRGVADHGADLPPLFRGMLALPGGRQILRHVATHAWHAERGTLDPAGPPDLGGSLFTAWTGPGVSFLHIEKCGGIAAMQWLSRQFHPEQINPDDHRDLPPHLCYRTPAFTGIVPARFPMIWGHYDLPTLRRIAPAHLVFILLREPQARLLSLYRFWRSVEPTQIDPDLSFSVALAHRLSLEDFLNCDDPLLLDLTDNLYVRRLTGLYATGAARDPLVADPDAALNAAALALETLGFVGLTEKLDPSLGGLAARLGIAAPPPGQRANVAADNHADPSGWFRASGQVERSPAVEAALSRRTGLDQALYARALAGFAQGQPRPL